MMAPKTTKIMAVLLVTADLTGYGASNNQLSCAKANTLREPTHYCAFAIFKARRDLSDSNITISKKRIASFNFCNKFSR